MKLLRSEVRIGLLNISVINEIIRELNEEYGPCETRRALANGYVSRVSKKNYLAIYTGRFGNGITVRSPLDYTTRYCAKTTYIWSGADMHTLSLAIEEVIKRHAR